MGGNVKRRIPTWAACSLVLTGALALWPATNARAQSQRVAVLGFGSDGVSEKLCSNFAAALREQVKTSEGYELDDAHASLDQLGMAQDCDVTNDSCLGIIAKRLSVQGFVYGTISLSAGGEVKVSANLFDAASSSVQKNASVSLSKKTASDAELKDRARSLADELLGRRHPVLRSELLPVESEGEGAVAGETSAEHEAAASRVAVDQGTPEPQRGHGLSAKRIAGVALLGTAAVSVGLSVLSFVEIDRAQGDQSFDRYRRAVGTMNPKADDVCAEADAGKHYGLDDKSLTAVRDKCSLGKTYEVLQYIFMGTALASGAVSAYLLLSGDDSAERAQLTGTKSLALHPVFSRRSLGMTARMHF